MEDKESLQSEYEEYILDQDLFSSLKEGSGKFGKFELIHKKPSGDEFQEADNNDYIRIQLSSDPIIFSKQIKLFVDTGYHPSIVQFEGFQCKPTNAAITRYYPNRSLQHILDSIRKNEKQFEWNDTMKSICIFGLVSAVNHLHTVNKDFSIRYLTPESIVFDKNNHPKLINYVFGYENLNGHLSNAYIAPELHLDQRSASHCEDVWSLGMIFYEILTGKKPFEGKSEEEIKEKVINGQIPELPLPETKEEAKLIEIIRKCLSKDPFERPRPFMLLNDFLINRPFNLADSTIYDIYRLSIFDNLIENDDTFKDYMGSQLNGLIEKVEQNDTFCMYLYGFMLTTGNRYVTKDIDKAFDLFCRCCDNQSPIGMFAKAKYLLKSNTSRTDQTLGYSLVRKAASFGIERACHTLGYLARDGIGVTKSLQSAIEIFREGANKGYRMCQYELGWFYLKGCEVLEKDVNKAITLLSESSRNGYVRATSDIGIIFFDMRKSYPSKMRNAINQFKKAARKNDVVALINLGIVYLGGEKYIQKDELKAINCFKKACEISRDPIASYEYGKCLKNGIGTPKNAVAALGYFRHSAFSGNKKAQHSYAKMLYDGEGTERNVVEALAFFKKAADQGVLPSMFYYAKILINGEDDIPKDTAEGKKYLTLYVNKVPQSHRIDGWMQLMEKIS